MTGLRIAFDLDGVLADLEEPYTAARLALFGSSSVPPSTGSAESAEEAESVEEAGTDEDSRSKTSAPRVRGLTRGQQSGVWKRIARVPDFWTTLRPLEPRVVHGIQSLATRYRWHVFFVTQRPRHGRGDDSAPDATVADSTGVRAARRDCHAWLPGPAGRTAATRRARRRHP